MKYIVLISLFFSCLACTSKKDSKLGQLNLALTSNIPTLDPAVSYDTVSAEVVYQVYEALYEYDYLVRPYQLKPLLAESFPKIENDGKKYTIKIKRGVFYHTNPAFKNEKREVVAQDFINQIKRIAYKPTQSNGWWLFSNKVKGLDEFREKTKDLKQFLNSEVSGLQAPDKYTLVIELKDIFPQLIHALAMAFTTPVATEVIQKYDNNLNLNTVGTGPYMLKKWNPNNTLTLIRNPYYHVVKYPSDGDSVAHEKKLLKDTNKKLPFIEKITFHIMKEAQTRWLNFLQGNIDVITLSKDHFPLALNKSGGLKSEITEKNIRLEIAPTLTFWWLAFNMTDPLLGKNLLLRKAIAHAVDTDRYIKDFTNNIGLKANSIFPPGIVGYSPSTKTSFNADKNTARELLKKAGFPNGEGLPVIQYDVRGASTVARQMGEFIQKELAEVGIKINVNTNSFSGFLNKARTGQLQMWQGGWAMDYPDPENVVQLLTTKNHPPGPNSTYFSDPEVDKLYEKLSKTIDTNRQKELTSEVEQIIDQKLPWVMQYYTRNYILLHQRVKNFRQSDLIRNYIKYLRVN